MIIFGINCKNGGVNLDVLVNVFQQKLRIVDYQNYFISGTQNFIKFIFNLDNAWKDLSITARFIQKQKYYDTCLDESNSVYMPNEITSGECLLFLYGVKDDIKAVSDYLILRIKKDYLSNPDISNGRESIVELSGDGVLVSNNSAPKLDENGVLIYSDAIVQTDEDGNLVFTKV